MKNTSVQELKNIAKDLRKKAVTMIYEAQSGHPGGSLSAADFVAACYFREMDINPQDPKWADRDRFVLSKGHVCPIQYAALATLGYFPLDVLHTLRKEGSMLQGHPDMKKCPGIDISTGSLGQGLACAVGMALAGKRDEKDYRVFCVVGDGEVLVVRRVHPRPRRDQDRRHRRSFSRPARLSLQVLLRRWPYRSNSA